MKRFSAIVAALLVGYGAMAQGGFTSGLLFDRDIVSSSSILSLSQRNYMGTARSMGMGGAFTSLGADISSLGYNPAGFGMYQRNEISVTVGLGINHTKAFDTQGLSSGNTTVRCALNNIGGSFQVFEGTGNLIALNFAFGYNKIADYNYDITYAAPSSVSSAADAFADIANRNGLSINSDNKICDRNGYYDYDMDPYFWTTALAYKCGLIGMGTNGWWPEYIGPNATTKQQTSLSSRGSAGEFSFALGGNIANIVYFGVSLDIQNISRKQVLYYNEFIGYTSGGKPDPATYPYQLRDFELGQAMQMSGSGVGAKFGIVVRPLQALRIGLAVHTPTFYSIAYRYNASLSSIIDSAGSNPDGFEVGKDGLIRPDFFTPRLEDIGNSRWEFVTPTRVLLGLSYTIGKYAIISADYEYDDFAGIRIKNAPVDYGFIEEPLRNDLKGVHQVRAGVEAKPISWLSLRAGGGYTSSVVATDYIFAEPVMNSAWSVSAGLGFRLSKATSIDVAYQYRNEEYTSFYTFYSENNNGVNASDLYGLDFVRHNVAVTFAFRF